MKQFLKLGVISVAFVVASIAGCSALVGKGPAIAKGIGDEVQCVLSHYGEPAGQIVQECEGVTIQDVIAIVEAHKRAMAKDAACAPAKVSP